MVFQFQKKQIILLLLILIALIIFTVFAVQTIRNDSGLNIAMAVEGSGTPVYGTIENDVSPWGIDAERYGWWRYST